MSQPGKNKHWPANALNTTLGLVVRELDRVEVRNWFIAYGTLLGITRADSCVEGDDDVDIVIDVSEAEKLFRMGDPSWKLWQHPEEIKMYTLMIGDDLPTLDFYLADVRDSGDWHDRWENVLWTAPMPLITREWRGLTLQLPANTERKLERRYGVNWRVPMEGQKGPAREPGVQVL